MEDAELEITLDEMVRTNDVIWEVAGEQEAMNPSKIFFRRGGTQYRLKDKVMQIRNDYDKEVFNGDIGTITKADMEERELTETEQKYIVNVIMEWISREMKK